MDIYETVFKNMTIIFFTLIRSKRKKVTVEKGRRKR